MVSRYFILLFTYFYFLFTIVRFSEQKNNITSIISSVRFFWDYCFHWLQWVNILLPFVFSSILHRVFQAWCLVTDIQDLGRHGKQGHAVLLNQKCRATKRDKKKKNRFGYGYYEQTRVVQEWKTWTSCTTWNFLYSQHCFYWMTCQ